MAQHLPFCDCKTCTSQRALDRYRQLQGAGQQNIYTPPANTSSTPPKPKRKVRSMFLALLRFSLKWALILYIPLGILSGAWHWQRDCKLPPWTDRGDRLFCSMFAYGFFWPIGNSVQFALKLTDPDLISSLPPLPSIKFEQGGK